MRTAPSAFDTRRLGLRRPLLGDAPEIFHRYASDPEVTRYVSWPRHRSVDDSRRFVAFADESWARFGMGPYLAFARDSGTLVGATGLDLGEEGLATTGYVLARDSWGLGYASELVAAMTHLASGLGLVQLVAHCHVDHVRSRRVLERAGFELEGVENEGLFFPNLGTDGASDVATYTREFGSHLAAEGAPNRTPA